MDSYATSCPALARLLNAPQHSPQLGLPGQWPISAHGFYHLINRRARHLRIALVVQQRFVRRSVDYAVDAVRRKCGQLVLHFEPTGWLFACSDYRQWCVTKASRAAHLCTSLGGGAEFFNGRTHLPRRGVEGLDLRA